MSLASWRNKEEFKGTGTLSEEQTEGGQRDERRGIGSFVRKGPCRLGSKEHGLDILSSGEAR